LFTIGGDGTQKGGKELYEKCCEKGYMLSVVGFFLNAVYYSLFIRNSQDYG
jgi:hypothetical protein